MGKGSGLTVFGEEEGGKKGKIKWYRGPQKKIQKWKSENNCSEMTGFQRKLFF